MSYSGAADSSMIIDGPRVMLSPKIARFANQYIRENNEALFKAKERSAACFDMMDSVFESYGLPAELKYLAVIESDGQTIGLAKLVKHQ